MRLTAEERAAMLRARAAKKEAEASSLFHKHDALLGVMNGTPVLRGHHSEGRHRRDLARIDRDMRKSFEAKRAAEALERSAVAAENNETISSDDPSAVELLTAKLKKLEADRELIKAMNVAIRKNDAAKLVELGCSEKTAAEFCKPDEFGRKGIPSYKLTNLGAEIRRVTARVAELKRMAEEKPREAVEVGGVTVTEEDNRLRLTFPGKPSSDMIATLKRNGFKWAPSVGSWQRQLTENARRSAEQVLCKVGAL